MNYVFDLDNTLCKSTCKDYNKSIPIKDRIEFVNRLYAEGNNITIYTARGMGSTNNNQIEAITRYYSFTQRQLELWGLKYHFLILGKPSADFYIDDKGIESENFFRSVLCS
jgi:hypothetical protein